MILAWASPFNLWIREKGVSIKATQSGQNH